MRIVLPALIFASAAVACALALFSPQTRIAVPEAVFKGSARRLMADLLRRLDPAITVLMIEHDMDIALELSPRVTVLHYGCVIADGSRDEVRADPQVKEIYLGA